MKRIGIDLGVLDGDKPAPFIHPACPGAKVFITRDTLRDMIQGGETFDESQTSVPRDGFGHARVRCGRPVQVSEKNGVAGQPVYYGLCVSCHGVEERNRAALRRARDMRSGKREAAE